MTPAQTPTTPERFPATFWTANVTELFERAAYYAMASFVVIYLGRLGLGDYWPSTLNGLLWTLIYFLPILSGTIADQIGFRRSLLMAFVLLLGGYLAMGVPVWAGLGTLADNVGEGLTAGPGVVVPVLVGILLIGVGGSFVKPCIAGTVQKTAGTRATLAFALFYMVINVGSLCGRGISYGVRTNTSLDMIFMVAAGCAVGAFFVVLALYRDPPRPAAAAAAPRRSPGRILLDMVLVLKNVRFSLFLLASSGFFFLYAQVYNVLPLYLKKVLETDPAVDLYTMANPFVIVFFQLLVTRLFGKMKPIRSIIVGIVVIALAMVVNLVPIFVTDDLRAPWMGWIPVGSATVVLTVALIAFGELFTSARTYEYIGACSPKGQEGLFLGYASLPTAIGALVGGPVGAAIFNEIMMKGATKRADGLLDPDPVQNALGWIILMGIGLASAVGMALYNHWIQKGKPEG
jgi:dipeptide/tripeptide permease